jgi:RNA methyltransferase, TrmH family
MLSKAQLKKLRALANKKQRKATGLFLVQGEKNVLELLNSKMKIVELFLSESFATQHGERINGYNVTLCTIEELGNASSLNSNDSAIAIVEQPTQLAPISKQPIIALDNVNDPGNLGTIIRLADWYGITSIIVSEQTADEFNPKVISATMGAFTRVHVHRKNLAEYFESCNRPIYGAFLNGESVHNAQFEPNAIILMGNESHGISEQLNTYVSNQITIPKYGQSESLNVAMATGIILDNLKRQLS